MSGTDAASAFAAKSRFCLPCFAAAGVLLFVLAPAFRALGSCPLAYPNDVDWISNRDVVLGGPIAPFFFEFGWYANIPFVVGMVALARSRRVALWLVLLQLVLVLSSLLPVPLLGPSESPARLCRWGLGYWMWFAVQAIVMAGGVASRARLSSTAGTGGADKHHA